MISFIIINVKHYKAPSSVLSKKYRFTNLTFFQHFIIIAQV